MSAAPALSRRRAAVALVALGSERATKVLAGLEESEVKQLAAEIAALGTVTPTEVRDTMTLLVRGLQGAGGSLPAPGKRYARDLLVRALGSERGTAAAAEMEAPVPFAWLAESDAEATAEALGKEPVSVIALALAHVEPKASARLLTLLPEQTRGQVAARIASLGPLHPETVSQVETGLRARLRDVAASPVQQLAGPTLLAGLIAKVDRDTGRQLLAVLAETDPELADATRGALFTFDDLCALPPKVLQVLLRAVDGRQLATSLLGIEDELRDRLLTNLSERAREGVLEDLDVLRDTKPAQVAEARTAVVATARRLEDEGTVELTRPDDA